MIESIAKIGFGFEGLFELADILLLTAIGALFVSGFLFVVLAPIISPGFRADMLKALKEHPVSATFNGILIFGFYAYMTYLFLGWIM